MSDIDVKTHGFDVAHRRYNPFIRSTACVRHSVDEGDEGSDGFIRWRLALRNDCPTRTGVAISVPTPVVAWCGFPPEDFSRCVDETTGMGARGRIGWNGPAWSSAAPYTILACSCLIMT